MTADMLALARDYLISTYSGVYHVRRVRDHDDGSRAYGSPLYGPDGPWCFVRVWPDGTLRDLTRTPRESRA